MGVLSRPAKPFFCALRASAGRILDIQCTSDTKPLGARLSKRYKRTLISPGAAREYAVKAKWAGSDHADLAGDCESPVTVAVTGLQDGRLYRLLAQHDEFRDDPFVDYAPGVGWIDPYGRPASKEWLAVPDDLPVHVDLAVRCRKCPACLRSRAAHWRMRAYAEARAVDRTWFGTLTLSAESQFKAASLARVRLASNGLDFDALSVSDQLAERHKQIGPEITRYLKRIRKVSGAKLRYMLVMEAHKSGLPHYHCLLHEVAGSVRHAQLQGNWWSGFSNWKLVDSGAVSYVCKYLSKSALARVRASVRYGETLGLGSSAPNKSAHNGPRPFRSTF